MVVKAEQSMVTSADEAQTEVSATEPEAEQATYRRVISGDEEDLRAMKRALANAPLGPKAVLALSSAILALEEDHPS